MINSIDIILILIIVIQGFVKIILKKLSSYFNPDTFTYFQQAISFVGLIPVFLFFVQFKFPFTVFNVLLVIIAGVGWYIGSLITNRSIKAADLTLREPILQTITIFVLIFSFFLLKEHISIPVGIGAGLIFLGTVISSLKEKIDYKNLRGDGIVLCLLAAFFVAISYTMDKYGLRFIDVLPWVFSMYFIPFLILLPKTKSSFLDLTKQSKKIRISFILITMIGTASYISLIYVLSKSNLSKSFPLSQLSSVIVFIGGLYLGERKNISYRITGSIVAIIGGILIFLN